MEDSENFEDEAADVTKNAASLISNIRNASMQGLGQYKTLKDMLVETSLDVDRIMDDEMGKYLDEDGEEEEAESEIPGTSALGNANFDMLIEGQTVEHFVNQCNGFYEEMKLKVSSLRRTPVVNNLIVKSKKDIDESNLFENMEHSPEVQKRLDAISKLDDDIKDIINTYKVERAARMEAQLEMCQELSQNPDCRERDSERFLQVCQFELSQCGSDEEDDKNGGSLEKTQLKPKTDGRFIKRNAEVAKEGYLAGCSLTDEEKSKIEEIMSVTDYDPDKKEKSKSQFTITDKVICEETYTNAYKFDDEQSHRIKDIDTELEKFALDEKNTEKYVSGLPKSYEDTGSICLLKREIANIDAKLKELRNRDEEEMEKNRERQLKFSKELDEDEEKELCSEDVDQQNQPKDEAVECETKLDENKETQEENENKSDSVDSFHTDEVPVLNS